MCLPTLYSIQKNSLNIKKLHVLHAASITSKAVDLNLGPISTGLAKGQSMQV